MDIDPTDVCQFGHQLAPGSDSITLKEIDPATGRLLKEEKRLLRRHVALGPTSKPLVSEFRPGRAQDNHTDWAASLATAYVDPIETAGHKAAREAAEARAAGAK